MRLASKPVGSGLPRGLFVAKGLPQTFSLTVANFAGCRGSQLPAPCRSKKKESRLDPALRAICVRVLWQHTVMSLLGYVALVKCPFPASLPRFNCILGSLLCHVESSPPSCTYRHQPNMVSPVGGPHAIPPISRSLQSWHFV